MLFTAQITFGTRVRNVTDIVRDLHGDPTGAETPVEKIARDPGRLHMRREQGRIGEVCDRAFGAF